MTDRLDGAVKYYEGLGSCRAKLGRAKVIEGYVVMVSPDETYYYWVNSFGIKSGTYEDKWRALRGAKLHAKRSAQSAPSKPARSTQEN